MRATILRYLTFAAVLSLIACDALIITPPLPTPPSTDYCPSCVTFFQDDLNELVNVIVNVGPQSTCSGLCGFLSGGNSVVLCNIFCKIHGIDTFTQMIEETDADAVYLCQQLAVCPIHDDASASITTFAVSPASGPQGTVFSLDGTVIISSTTGAGFWDVTISPPDAMIITDATFVESLVPGTYNAHYTMATNPTENEPFSSGTYDVQFAVCNGVCGAKHAHAKLLASKRTSFTIA